MTLWTALDDVERRLPTARHSDPLTSHEAAVAVKPANTEIVTYIRRVVEQQGPITQEHIANHVCAAQPGRWTHGTIVTACKRAGLHQWGTATNGRGRTVATWVT